MARIIRDPVCNRYVLQIIYVIFIESTQRQGYYGGITDTARYPLRDSYIHTLLQFKLIRFYTKLKQDKLYSWPVLSTCLTNAYLSVTYRYCEIADNLMLEQFLRTAEIKSDRQHQGDRTRHFKEEDYKAL